MLLLHPVYPQSSVVSQLNLVMCNSATHPCWPLRQPWSIMHVIQPTYDSLRVHCNHSLYKCIIDFAFVCDFANKTSLSYHITYITGVWHWRRFSTTSSLISSISIMVRLRYVTILACDGITLSLTFNFWCCCLWRKYFVISIVQGLIRSIRTTSQSSKDNRFCWNAAWEEMIPFIGTKSAMTNRGLRFIPGRDFWMDMMRHIRTTYVIIESQS